MGEATIAGSLLQRLQQIGIEHLFGVPGDSVLRFYQQLSDSSIRQIGTTREDAAAFAADGYARCKGLGAQIGQPELRPLILVGDGAFQMTGTELSSIVRLGLDPPVVAFNNHGYSTERLILDGPFNDIAS